MRIALIDNMNNNFFALARYLRDLGNDADLYLIPNSVHSHFEPDKDTWNDVSKLDWIKVFPCSYHWSSYFKSNNSSLRELFSKYDKIIACGPAIALLYKAKVKIDLFIPYGDDLINIPFPSNYHGTSFRLFKSLFLFFFKKYLAHLQSKGIKSARCIISNSNWKVAKEAVEKIGCTSTSLNLPRVMVYKELMPAHIIEKYSWIKNYDFSVFSPTRHLWKTNSEPLSDFQLNGGAKRNDKLIRAFSRVVKENIYRKPILIFCDYGSDVEYSKILIKELNIEKSVFWLPILPRKEIVAIASLSTIVADQFREGMCATSAGTTNEALAYGVPVITNTDSAIKLSDDPYFGAPIIEALTEDEIYISLCLNATNRQLYNHYKSMSEKWFDKNLGIGLAKKYLQVMNLNTSQI